MFPKVELIFFCERTIWVKKLKFGANVLLIFFFLLKHQSVQAHVEIGLTRSTINLFLILLTSNFIAKFSPVTSFSYFCCLKLDTHALCSAISTTLHKLKWFSSLQSSEQMLVFPQPKNFCIFMQVKPFFMLPRVPFNFFFNSRNALYRYQYF